LLSLDDGFFNTGQFLLARFPVQDRGVIRSVICNILALALWARSQPIPNSRLRVLDLKCRFAAIFCPWHSSAFLKMQFSGEPKLHPFLVRHMMIVGMGDEVLLIMTGHFLIFRRDNAGLRASHRPPAQCGLGRSRKRVSNMSVTKSALQRKRR
jgi:hypothetical protein